MINDNENEAKNEKQITKIRKNNLGQDMGINTLEIKFVLVQ